VNDINLIAEIGLKKAWGLGVFGMWGVGLWGFRTLTHVRVKQIYVRPSECASVSFIDLT